MLDLGWGELLVIGIVALIVIGPNDLPVMFRNVGRFVGKAKGMAREFSRAMNDAADEAGVKDVARTLKTATNPVSSAMEGVKDAARDLTRSVDPTRYDPGSETGKLAAERAEQAKKTQAAAAERKAKEAAARADAPEAALTEASPETKT